MEYNMTSTISNKKGIADFLWEWAGTTEWAKSLVDKVIRSEEGLCSTERQTIFDYFLQSIGLHTGLPPLQITKPTYIPTDKEIQLIALSEITGVNCLAKNQKLEFSPNITVIYGENGTGKTGYSRVLKSMGFSYDKKNNILQNIFSSQEPKHAKVEYSVDKIAKTFDWEGVTNDSELENISVFNSHCVQFSLEDRHLIVAPIGFHLFNLVTGELKELQKLYDAKRATYPIDLPWSMMLSPGTPQQIFISSLHAKSDVSKLTTLSSFAPAHQMEQEEAEQTLSGLNRTLLETEIKNLNAIKGDLEMAIVTIQATKNKLPKTTWDLYKDCVETIQTLESQTQTGLAAIAESRGISFYQSGEFNAFIRAAENYILLLENPTYPGEKDICIYCQQPLDEAGRQLLADYRRLLNDKTRENLENQKQRKLRAIELFTSVGVPITLTQPSFGEDTEGLPVQPGEITEYNELIAVYKSRFMDDGLVKTDWEEFDFSKYVDFLSSAKQKFEVSLLKKRELLLTLSQQEITLKNKIAELRDRKLLSTKLTEINAVLENLKITQIFKDNFSAFNSAAISRKTTEAREELVRQNFDAIFKKELAAFRKADIKIELHFATERGSSKVTQRIGSYVPTDILSEGEQKAIALAEFLTELQLDHIKAPVIFDDPVNSLDHRIMDEVAKRLIRLSETRQVVVFTHNILLLNSFIQQNELPNNVHIKSIFHHVKRDLDETGFLVPFQELNSITSYLSNLNVLLASGKTGRDEGEMAAQGYGHLRAAIELFVEEEMFQRVVKRYRKGVAFPALMRVNGNKIEECKTGLNDIYEKCCVSIEGHSSPTELHTTPTLAELKTDLEAFKEIRKAFKN
jgi:recombinational DNA repair ATPase RecF